MSSFLPVPNDVHLLSAVGDDSNGDTILAGLVSQGVGVGRIQRYRGDSPWCYIMVCSNTRTCVFQPGSEGLSVKHVRDNLTATDGDGVDDRDRVDDEDESLVLNGFGAAHFDGRHLDASVYLAGRFDSLAIPYSVDVERPRGEGLLKLLSGASIVLCNSEYCRLSLGLGVDDGGCFFNEKEIVCNLRRVLGEQAPRARIGLTTLGSKGSCLIILNENDAAEDSQRGKNGLDISATTEEVNIILEKHDKFPDSPRVIERHGALWCDPWDNCNIIDTTGAGDVFQGAFLAVLWNCAAALEQRQQSIGEGAEVKACRVRMTHSPLEVPVSKLVLAYALRIGTRVAGLKLNGLGSRVALPGTDEFIESELKMIMVESDRI